MKGSNQNSTSSPTTCLDYVIGGPVPPAHDRGRILPVLLGQPETLLRTRRKDTHHQPAFKVS